MSAIGWVIDDDGHPWGSHSRALSKRLQTNRSAASLLPFLIESMGWISVRQKGSAALIRFDSEAVGCNALVGCIFWLLDQRVRGVAIDQHGQVACAGTLMRLQAAIDYLGALAEKRRMQTAFRRTRLNLSETPYANRVAATREVFNLVHQKTTRTAILDNLFAGLFTAVSRLDRSNGEYVIDSLASRQHPVDPNYADALLGKPLRDIPDRAYGAWVASSYREAQETEAAVLDDIEATVFVLGNPKRLHRYSRLLVPVTTGSGERYIVTASTNFA